MPDFRTSLAASPAAAVTCEVNLTQRNRVTDFDMPKRTAAATVTGQTVPDGTPGALTATNSNSSTYTNSDNTSSHSFSGVGLNTATGPLGT
jgi:hypothetical protein